MNMRQQVAEQIATLVVGGLSLLGVSSGMLVPGAVLAACGLDRRRTAREASGQAAVDAVIAVLNGHPNDATTRAVELLSRYRDRIRVDPAMLQDAQTRDDFPATLYQITFGTEAEIEPAVETLLREVIRNAYEALRHAPDFHRIWVQESLGSVKRAAMKQGITITDLDIFIRDDAKQTALVLKSLGDAIATSRSVGTQENSELKNEIGRLEAKLDRRAQPSAAAQGLQLFSSIERGGHTPEEIADLLYAVRMSGVSLSDITLLLLERNS